MALFLQANAALKVRSGREICGHFTCSVKSEVTTS